VGDIFDREWLGSAKESIMPNGSVGDSVGGSVGGRGAGGGGQMHELNMDILLNSSESDNSSNRPGDEMVPAQGLKGMRQEAESPKRIVSLIQKEDGWLSTVARCRRRGPRIAAAPYLECLACMLQPGLSWLFRRLDSRDSRRGPHSVYDSS
jgi:hypothetical protein